MTVFSENAFKKISAKTADYRMKPEDLGTLFTTRGAAGAVVFTLPITTDIQTGWWVEVFSAAGQNCKVQTYNTLDNVTTFNDLTADSVSWETVSELIGGSWRLVWDGTGWLTFIFSEETQTMTVA